jgi:protein involved in polysaccharide export with SLBB domain
MSNKYLLKMMCGKWGVNFGLLLVSLLLAGCESLAPSSEPDTGTNNSPAIGVDTLRVGDSVKIDFSGLSTTIPSHEEQIKDDGTINLPLIEKIVAAGKTTAELQNEIRTNYVPKYYKFLTIVVRTADRFYYVGGEVRAPNRQLYLGGVTVLKAIQSAGDFTDFSNKKNVRVIRANGRIDVVNCIKARKNPKLDLPVYPGDTIHVERSIL